MPACVTASTRALGQGRVQVFEACRWWVEHTDDVGAVAASEIDLCSVLVDGRAHVRRESHFAGPMQTKRKCRNSRMCRIDAGDLHALTLASRGFLSPS